MSVNNFLEKLDSFKEAILPLLPGDYKKKYFSLAFLELKKKGLISSQVFEDAMKLWRARNQLVFSPKAADKISEDTIEALGRLEKSVGSLVK